MVTNKIRRDGHIHTPYCPHGSADVYEQYIHKILNGKSRGISETQEGAVPAFRPYVDTAIREDLDEISFTEHMPFPCYFTDDKAYLDCCAMNKNLVPDYFSDLRKIRNEYAGRIRIHTGFEVDFLDGYEEKTAELLNSYGSELTDGILSVHFVRYGNKIYDIDVRDGFEKVLGLTGSVEAVYDLYYQTLLKAVTSDLGNYKPRRIGHPNIIRMFRLLYPTDYENKDLLQKIVLEIKERGYEVDADTAGLRKPYCRELYLSGYFKKLVEEKHIPVVYGSDAHFPDDVGKNFDQL